MRMLGYKPKIGAAGDCMPFYWKGTWHIFFLVAPENVWTVPERVACRLAHIASNDLVEWTELPDALVPGPAGSADGSGVWTGSLIERNGRFYFFYTGYCHTAKYEQTICRAVSDDLVTWTKDPNNPQFKSDGTWYEPADWRDPFVYWDEEKGTYTMLMAARELSGPMDRRGCIAVAYSDDLERWTVKGPRWSPRQVHVMECPETFRLGDYRYLVFSRYSGDAKTLYRVARSSDDPWEARPLDSIDGAKFYAAKSAGDGKRRITFAWVPQRQRDNPKEEFIWGGHLGSPRELVSLPDGTLTCRLPEEIVQSYTQLQAFQFAAGDGKWQGEGSHRRCDARGSYGFGHVKTARTELMLELDLVCEPNTMSAGILLEPTADMQQGHLLMIEPACQRASIRRWPIKWEPYWQDMVAGSPALGPHTDMEHIALVDRWLPSRPKDDTYRIRVLRTGQLVECYVNNQVTLTYRIYEQAESMFGFFVDQGAASFQGMTIKS
jgi:beta-fructofuranosidase